MILQQLFKILNVLFTLMMTGTMPERVAILDNSGLLPNSNSGFKTH
ncbi:MAG: hypothetical protein QXH66_05660 [Conexivisphaerales archaeon]